LGGEDPGPSDVGLGRSGKVGVSSVRLSVGDVLAKAYEVIVRVIKIDVDKNKSKTILVLLFIVHSPNPGTLPE